MMKLIISCGGTGGHIMPALAIADTVQQNRPDADILFFGSEGGMEERLVKGAGYRLCTLRVQGLSRSLSPRNLRVLRDARRAVEKAKEALLEYAPDLVIGTGGYACYPTLRAAQSMGIPTALHESNAVPGLTVRMLSAKADRVWLNFEGAGKSLSHKARTLCVGNPLSSAFLGGATAPDRPRDCRQAVLSFGGSLGAAEINRAVLVLMQRERDMEGVYHLHATGKREYEKVFADFCRLGLDRCPRLSLVPFIPDMPQQMRAADLVIARAGAMTLSEIAALGKAAVLVPSPNVSGNHQYKNAKVLSDAGAAFLLEEHDLAGTLPEVALDLLQSTDRRQALSRAIVKFARPDANRRILADILQLIKK